MRQIPNSPQLRMQAASGADVINSYIYRVNDMIDYLTHTYGQA